MHSDLNYYIDNLRSDIQELRELTFFLVIDDDIKSINIYCNAIESKINDYYDIDIILSKDNIDKLSNQRKIDNLIVKNILDKISLNKKGINLNLSRILGNVSRHEYEILEIFYISYINQN